MNRPIEARPERRVARTRAAQRRVRARPVTLPLTVAALMMLLGVVMRLPTVFYQGEREQHAFNNYIFQFIGAYSDIPSLYFRDQLWRHPLPYFDYYLEYPVGLAWLIWLINFVHSDVMAYFYATALVLIVSGLLVIWLGRRFRGANLWLLAFSPTLVLYTVLNWDMFSILLTVAALLLLQQDRDRWGGALLTAAVWTKFFPIVLVPLVLLDRVIKRRWRDAVEIGAIFGVGSVLINAPFAIQPTPDGWRLRDAWLHFFRFNQQRGREVNLWNFFDPLNLSLQQINTLSALFLIAGIGAIMWLMYAATQNRAWQGRDLLLPAALAAIGWFFFINKVYSPQYSLWLAVLMALLAAPTPLFVAFAAVDVVYFAASFIALYLHVTQNPATDWFFNQAMLPSMAVREATILLIIGWAAWRIVRADAADAEALRA